MMAASDILETLNGLLREAPSLTPSTPNNTYRHR
jgi:hypothetical protein